MQENEVIQSVTKLYVSFSSVNKVQLQQHLQTQIKGSNMIYTGDTGTIVRLDTLTDITTATSLVIKVKKPSGVSATWVATLEGTTVLKYISVNGDFNESGTYKMQPQVVMPGFTGSGDITQVQVDSTLA